MLENITLVYVVYSGLTNWFRVIVSVTLPVITGFLESYTRKMVGSKKILTYNSGICFYLGCCTASLN